MTLTPNAAYSGGNIVYSKTSGPTLHENITKLTDEEFVRAYLVARLVKELRYPATSIELEKGYTIGRPTWKSAQLDIRVLDHRTGKKPKTFMLIEVKRPDDYDSYKKTLHPHVFVQVL